jgi:hypothetical protein
MIKTGEKVIYNLDGERNCMEWAKDELKSENLVQAQHTLSSGCKVSDKKPVNWDRDSIGYIFYKGNNIYHNITEVGIMSLPFSDGSGYSITKDNFDKTLAIFCARRAFSRYGATWINNKDEFCVPNIHSEVYKVLLENSIPYMLFNGATHVASIKIYNEDGTVMHVPNEFHHISLEETSEIFAKYDTPVDGPGEFKDRYMTDRLNIACH